MNGNCKTVVHCTKHGCIPKTPTVDYKHELGNLLCRIHRDGGQYIQEHGWRKAIDDADAICAKMNARLDAIDEETARKARPLPIANGLPYIPED